jgi:hypothetical protein
MLNKRGQGLSTNAIVLIVLGVVVLVILIIGFTIGWGNIAPWLSSDNVDTIVNQCDAACSTTSKYDFCTKERTLRAEKEEIDTTCAIFSVVEMYSKYGVSSCPSIDCGLACGDITVENKNAVERDVCGENEEDITSIANVGMGIRCCIAKE